MQQSYKRMKILQKFRILSTTLPFANPEGFRSLITGIRNRLDIVN